MAPYFFRVRKNTQLYFLHRHFDVRWHGRKKHRWRKNSGCGSDFYGWFTQQAAVFLFSDKSKEKIFPTGTTEEPLDCGKDNMLSTCVILSLCIVLVFCFSKGKIIFGDGGGSGGFSDFGWQHSRFCAAAFGSTFHTSRLAKLISEECIIWRLGKEGMNET